ncbi:DUF397 domain-containing protein [Streptomyces pluripotens]|uniref:DUF397 domain-containing protein n=1 Tax=Streptomyces pluripotens TaxID=1355015 RepID=A0A221P0J9_9ACTN|nr:DUF397 domain-containing protein [Streptomyces pluripotens]ARP71421.1 DUF397 domain-containing protein [Streptomyces pluripotens]ASN25674.1 DUF397 domain-containing protein [Streptomyces pluripotens]
MPALTWQRSSYCPEGNSCIQIAATPGTIHLTESADPGGAVLSATPAAFGALLSALRQGARGASPIEIAFGEKGVVRLRETSTPDTVVTTDRRRWDAFVRGVRAGEFDHFVASVER